MFLLWCSDASSGAKEAAGNAVGAAKDVVKSSQKEAEVVGTGDASPTGRDASFMLANL